MKWFLLKLTFLFLLLLFSKCSVVELNEKNFRSSVLLNEKSDWVIKFYASSCSNCKRMEKDFKEASLQIKGDVQFGAVECPKYPELCRSHQINGYPTVKFHSRKGFWINYQGDSSVSDYVQFAKKNSDQPIKEVSDTDLIKRYTSYNLPTFLIVYPHSFTNNEIKSLKEILIEISKTENLLCSYFFINAQDFQMKNSGFDTKLDRKISFSSIVRVPKIVSVFNDDFELYQERNEDLRSLAEWLKQNSYRNVIHYNEENLELISNQKKLIAIAIIDSDNLDSLKIRSNMQILAKLTDEFFFTWANIKDDFKLGKHYNIGPDEAPLVLVIDLQSHSYWKQTEDHSNETPNDIFLFLEDIKNYKVEMQISRDTTSFVQFLFEAWAWILAFVSVFVFTYYKYLKHFLSEKKSKSLLD
ncbi:protein disulfide-isomerase tmx3 [Anaeramoeba flamelloides]|uniref:Protein disulfide-isomerase tmx3 n=1 Tax=Anaeramoeba flamelloides TaxID=1746091 RepID=A0AAV7YZW9_9EUKA|nr:protein disulfide-isomerase tmx3 [Anaeramoeba flamelloides]